MQVFYKMQAFQYVAYMQIIHATAVFGVPYRSLFVILMLPAQVCIEYLCLFYVFRINFEYSSQKSGTCLYTSVSVKSMGRTVVILFIKDVYRADLSGPEL